MEGSEEETDTTRNNNFTITSMTEFQGDLLQDQYQPQQHQQQQNDGASSDDGGGVRSYGSAMIPLGDDFEPGEDDVLVGRGKVCRNWTGNVRFRDLVESRLDDYSVATTKLEKSSIVTAILREIRSRTPNGGFIKKDPATSKWYEVGDFVARERVTQCFRDALHGKYRSSNSSKKKRRKEELKRAKQAAPNKKQKQHHEEMKEQDTKVAHHHPQAPPPSLTGPESMLFSNELSTSMLREGLAFPSYGQQSRRASLFPAGASMQFPDAPLSPTLLRRESLLGGGGSRRDSLLGGLGGSNTNVNLALAMQQHPQHSMSLEEQIQMLQQNINSQSASSTTTATASLPSLPPFDISGEPKAQDPYPMSWFKVNSNSSRGSQQQQPPQLTASAGMNATDSAVYFADVANSSSTRPSSQQQQLLLQQQRQQQSHILSPNLQSHTFISDQSCTTQNNSSGYHPGSQQQQVRQQQQQQQNNNMGMVNALAGMDFGAFLEDDNPFEPRPIAEDISMRNGANRMRRNGL